MSTNVLEQQPASNGSGPIDISFDELLAPNETSLEKLREAITGDGVFRLKLENSAAEDVLKTADSVFQCAKDLFNCPLEEKLEYDIERIGTYHLDGYKPIGRTEGVTEGKKDGYETYLISRNSLFDGRSLQPVVQSYASMFQTFTHQSHFIGTTILKAIQTALSLKNTNVLTASHQEEQRSTTAIGLLKYSPLSATRANLGHSAHTDVGTLTILFTRRPGLQVMPRNTEEWIDVDPLPGHVIINTGDCLRDLTNQRITPCLHRVVPTAQTETIDRYSCAYFMRPNFDATLQNAAGVNVPSIEYHKQKYAAFDAPAGDHSADFIRAGKHAGHGLWAAPVGA